VRILVVSLLIVVADQLTKLRVKGISLPSLGIDWTGLPYGRSHDVLGEFFRLTYIENPGMAFGLDFGWKPFFSMLSIAAGIAILIYLYAHRNERFPFRLSLALILGGAIGNLIDRMFYGVIWGDGRLFQGRVVDFLDLDFFDINLFGLHLNRWPVFNIADAAVTVGVILLLLTHRAVDEAKAAHPAGVAPTKAEP
jgi:signal peptidase II